MHPARSGTLYVSMHSSFPGATVAVVSREERNWYLPMWQGPSLAYDRIQYSELNEIMNFTLSVS